MNSVARGSDAIASFPELAPAKAGMPGLSQALRSNVPPIAILGIPIDPMTVSGAIEAIEVMLASKQPHYIVTPNVDFLVQAQEDMELRRILCQADLVLCDGTPLVWASRLLGNPLPERVAGADVVPRFIEVAAQKGYRLFFLGGHPQSAERGIAKLRRDYPTLNIAGYYSPPFNPLLEMDHDEIRHRVLAAKPDVMFVCFGCPKQEKWIAMHYRNLGVPVLAGVGGTLEFLAGTVKRAPVWMRRTGTEWLFRLWQEPRRLFRRYTKDLWAFSWCLLRQWWRLSLPARRRNRARGDEPYAADRARSEFYQNNEFTIITSPERLDLETIQTDPPFSGAHRLCLHKHLFLDLSRVRFIDSSGVGLLLRLHKQLRGERHRLVLIAPSNPVQRALALLHLSELFLIAQNTSTATHLLRHSEHEPAVRNGAPPGGMEAAVLWRGDVTASNKDAVWQHTHARLTALAPTQEWSIDLSGVRFIDSSGLGLMLRLKKFAQSQKRSLAFLAPSPPVINVLRLSRLESHLLQHESSMSQT